jgi:probable rRNA maturation factor
MQKKSSIDLQIASGIVDFPKKEFFELIVDSTLGEKRVGTQLTIRIVSIAESAYLNKKYRKIDSPTNVLSFASDGIEKILPSFIGDIVICASAVSKEAFQQDKDVEAHWAHMTVHGILHLLGLDHKESVEAAVMENRERTILSLLGYSDPYEKT